MKNHTDLLNLIADQIGAEKYLEIGVFNVEHNFNSVAVKNKTGVDPAVTAEGVIQASSDDLFSETNELFDLILVDGLHHADQVKRDINNAWRCLNVGGVIVIHDSNPHSERITHVPRDSREWTGDVYKTVCKIGCDKFTADFDYGCCIVRKESIDQKLNWSIVAITWEVFDKHRKELLNLVSIDQAIELILKFSKIKSDFYAIS